MKVIAVNDAWIAEDPTACPECSRDSCEDHLPSTPRPTFALPILKASDLVTASGPTSIIEGFAYADRTTILVGESGTGKTFIVTDAVAAVSDSRGSWHGRAVVGGSVCIINYDGGALGVRLQAKINQGHHLQNLYVVPASNPLSPRLQYGEEQPSLGEREIAATLMALKSELASTNRPPIRMVITETLNASMSGSEDSSETAAAYHRAVCRLRNCVPGAAWLITHHAGWQDGDQRRRRERGSSAWRGNTDVTLYLQVNEDSANTEPNTVPLILTVLKDRDYEKAPPLHLIRRRVELSQLDEQGRPMTSCVIEGDTRTRADREARVATALRQEAHELDLRVLRVIADRPDVATSQDGIRLILGIRKAIVAAALGRLIAAGWILPGPRKQPYTVTDSGRLAVEGKS